MKQAERDRVWREVVSVVMDNLGDWRKKVADASGLPFSRFRALRRLIDGPLTLKELAESTGTDAPATTVIVNALEESGLVLRETHPDDRRVKVVTLTAAGKKVVAAGQAAKGNAPAVFDKLEDDDVTALAAIVTRLRSTNNS